MNKDLLRDNYLIVRNFISESDVKKHSSSFYQSYRQNELNDDWMVPKSVGMFNPTLAYKDLLQQKCGSVSKFVGCKVVPTYVYARMYKNGGILKKHTDRPACEISVTLHLGGDTSWPIWIQTPEGDAVSVNLQEGDAMIYLGCIAPHWRNIYFGNTYAQVFLHYVRKNGIYASEENDSADDPYANANTKKLLEEYRQLL
tara:strand:- start:137 stop:733 length:597 start_codon:yes stop_codon:yes gene_type:complete